jgi:CspA family cold shock protein
MAMLGTVDWFSGHFGYGFITGEDGQRYFTHWSFIDMPGYRTLHREAQVSFDPLGTYKGWQARNVKLASPGEDAQVSELRPNPFTPHQPVTEPAKFAGRRDPLRNAIDALYNRKGVFVGGARGIGKTSLANQLRYLVEGETYLLDQLGIDSGGYQFKYLAIDHQCFPGHQIADLCAGLATSLQSKLRRLEARMQTTVKHSINLKVYQATLEQTQASALPIETIGQFTYDLEQAWDDLVRLDYNGICLFIDELDWLGGDVPIAFFLKSLTEKLRADGFLDTCFIIVGDTSYIATLMTQHESSLRLFETVPVPRMTEAESHEVITRALEGSRIEIEESAAQQIVELSAGFPTPIQQLGYHSFRLDSDNQIGIGDVQSGLRHVIEELRNEEFSMQRRQLALGPEETLVLTIARGPEDGVGLDYLLWKTGIDVQQLGAALASAEQKGFILRSGREFYTIREPLFRLYLRWKEGLS